MPEGDTLERIAQAIRPLLIGHKLVSGRLRDAPEVSLADHTVRDVSAWGKHLFIDFENEQRLRSHLGMHGSWHRYDRDEPWKRPRQHASIVLTTKDNVLVCFYAAEVELRSAASMESRGLGRRVGQDLTAAEVDFDDVVERIHHFLPRWGEDLTIEEFLLRQSIAAGIGNIYKSESLFLERLFPFKRVSSLDDGVLRNLYQRNHELLRANLGGGPRRTRMIDDGAGLLWVYGREDEPCLRCDGRIRRIRAGRPRRSTYWCQLCQPQGEENETFPVTP